MALIFVTFLVLGVGAGSSIPVLLSLMTIPPIAGRDSVKSPGYGAPDRYQVIKVSNQ